MPSPQTINALLEQAAQLLDRAASEIRDAPLKPTSKNIRHIGEALSEIFEIQLQIHALHPELAPSYMNEPSKDPAKAFEGTMERVKLFEAAGENQTAIAFLRQFISRQGSALEQVRMAERKIAQIEGKDA